MPPSESALSAIPTPAGVKRDTLEQAVKRFAENKPASPPIAARPALSGDDIAELERLAGGLKKTTHPGPAAKDIAAAFLANGPGGEGQQGEKAQDALSTMPPERKNQIGGFLEAERKKSIRLGIVCLP